MSNVLLLRYMIVGFGETKRLNTDLMKDSYGPIM